jgi:DNA-directed RNA polymerase subunit RPC12/RpoP
MNDSGKCVICGAERGCGMLVMGQYVCLDCQTLLDDPRRRVFGCPHSRRITRPGRQKRMELVKTRD